MPMTRSVSKRRSPIAAGSDVEPEDANARPAHRRRAHALDVRPAARAVVAHGLLRNLHALYDVLETRLAQHADLAALAPGRLPGLARTAAIEQDLLALHGRGWSDRIDLQPEAARYARHLQALAPPLLLAHVYVRYLGDLSGGQMLKAVVARSIAPEDGGGTAFYDFGSGQPTRELAQSFRSSLAAVILDAATSEAVVQEARLAFQMHCDLFESLAAAYLPLRPD